MYSLYTYVGNYETINITNPFTIKTIKVFRTSLFKKKKVADKQTEWHNDFYILTGDLLQGYKYHITTYIYVPARSVHLLPVKKVLCPVVVFALVCFIKCQGSEYIM